MPYRGLVLRLAPMSLWFYRFTHRFDSHGGITMLM